MLYKIVSYCFIKENDTIKNNTKTENLQEKVLTNLLINAPILSIQHPLINKFLLHFIRVPCIVDGLHGLRMNMYKDTITETSNNYNNTVKDKKYKNIIESRTIRQTKNIYNSSRISPELLFAMLFQHCLSELGGGIQNFDISIISKSERSYAATL